MAPNSTVPRVLIADDDIQSRDALGALFAPYGLHPVAFGDGEGACDHLAEHDCALVMASTTLEGIDAIELVRFLRLHDRTTPAYAVGGLVDAGTRRQLLNAGVNGLIERPIQAVQAALIAHRHGFAAKAGEPALRSARDIALPARQAMTPLSNPRLGYATR